MHGGICFPWNESLGATDGKVDKCYVAARSCAKDISDVRREKHNVLVRRGLDIKRFILPPSIIHDLHAFDGGIVCGWNCYPPHSVQRSPMEGYRHSRSRGVKGQDDRGVEV